MFLIFQEFHFKELTYSSQNMGITMFEKRANSFLKPLKSLRATLLWLLCIKNEEEVSWLMEMNYLQLSGLTELQTPALQQRNFDVMSHWVWVLPSTHPTGQLCCKNVEMKQQLVDLNDKMIYSMRFNKFVNIP